MAGVSPSAAGERGIGDVSDDDTFEERKRAVDLRGQRTQELTLPPPPRPLTTRPSVTFDMLVSCNLNCTVPWTASNPN